MSNMAHYSPFNRSYQFIHLQNSAYHFKNKQNIRPMVKTNLKRKIKAFSQSVNNTSSSPQRHSFSQINSSTNIRPHSSRAYLGEFNQPRRVIHRNEITERAKSARITRQNLQIVKRLIDTECMVTDKTQASTFYQKHKAYRNLRRRYQQNGERRMMEVGNIQLLNPTLASFRTSHHQHSNHSRVALSNIDDMQ